MNQPKSNHEGSNSSSNKTDEQEVETVSKKLLVEPLAQYVEELEALKNSLHQVMSLFDTLHDTGNTDTVNFIEKHGKEIVKEGQVTKFILDPDKKTDFDKLRKEVYSIRSAQRLMPRNFVVALICSYDSFFGKLIRYVFTIKPEILDASDRELKYSDLLEFSDLNSAREYLIEKEIETILRKSHTDHFKWLEKTFSIPFNKNLPCWPGFVELTERRNLFVHTDGAVSSQYLQVCKNHKCTIDPAVQVGEKLDVSTEYFKNSFQILYEIGFKMAHVIWRKLAIDDISDIDNNLIEKTYDLITSGEYLIAVRILEFFTQKQMEHENESVLRVLTINLAQAYKWSGNNIKCSEVLDRFDWSASGDRFKLAFSVLKDEWGKAFSYMRRLKNDDAFDKSFYKTWPVFQEFIQKSDFIECYKECYGEEFLITEQSSVDDNDS